MSALDEIKGFPEDHYLYYPEDAWADTRTLLDLLRERDTPCVCGADFRGYGYEFCPYCSHRIETEVKS